LPEGALELGRVSNLDPLAAEAESLGGRVTRRLPLVNPWTGRIHQSGNAGDSRDCVLEQLPPLPDEVRADAGDPREIPPGSRETGDEPQPDRIREHHEDNGNRAGRALGDKGPTSGGHEAFPKRFITRGITVVREPPDPVDLPRGLRMGEYWHCDECNEKAEERAGELHWILSSARASTDGGIVRLRALAVLRLITRSKTVGSSTGRSAGFAPLRIRSTYHAVRRQIASKFGAYVMRQPAATNCRWSHIEGSRWRRARSAMTGTFAAPSNIASPGTTSACARSRVIAMNAPGKSSGVRTETNWSWSPKRAAAARISARKRCP